MHKLAYSMISTIPDILEEYATSILRDNFVVIAHSTAKIRLRGGGMVGRIPPAIVELNKPSLMGEVQNQG